MTRWFTASLAVAVVGLLAVAVGFVADPRQAAFSWLAAWSFAWTTVLGAVVLLAVSWLAPIRWLAALRPAIAALGGTMPVVALGFLPVALSVRLLYPWTHAPDPGLGEAARRSWEHHAAWLGAPWFVLRQLGCLALWSILAVTLRGLVGVAGADASRRRWAAIAVLLIGPTWTLFAMDGLMSLDAVWWSSIFGILSFSGGFLAALAATVVLARGLEAADVVPTLPPDVYHALGRLLLTFVIFWAYIAYDQLVIIWMADLPAEIGWYVPRLGAWAPYGIALLAVHFALPLAALLSRALKRDRRAMAVVGAWLLVAHALDAVWLVAPELHPVPHLSWIDVAAFLAVGGSLSAATAWRVGPAPSWVALPSMDYRSP